MNKQIEDTDKKIDSLIKEVDMWYGFYIREAQLNDKFLQKLWGVESVLLLKEKIPSLTVCRMTLRITDTGKCPVHGNNECLDLYLQHEPLVEALDKHLHPKEL